MSARRFPKSLRYVAAALSVALLGTTASADLYGPNLKDSYDYSSDLAVNLVLVTYTAFPFPSAGTVDYLVSNVLNGGSNYGTFTAYQLRPLGGNDYVVVASQEFTVPDGDNPGYQYLLDTPWTVQAGGRTSPRRQWSRNRATSKATAGYSGRM